MFFEGFFYFKLWWPFYSAEQNHFSNFGKRALEEHFCEIILKSGHKPGRRWPLKVFFSIFSSGSHFVQPSWTILAILVESLKEHSCKIISKSINPFRRRCLWSRLLIEAWQSTHFLARLFSKKTTRYCHSSGVVCVVVVVQKLGHFVISLSLLKIFTWNSD